MLASEACPICGTRIEGKPTPSLTVTGLNRGRRVRPASSPRWGFECISCEHSWLAEPVSDSLNLGPPKLEIRMHDSAHLRLPRPYQNVEDFYPPRRWSMPSVGWLGTFGGLLMPR